MPLRRRPRGLFSFQWEEGTVKTWKTTKAFEAKDATGKTHSLIEQTGYFNSTTFESNSVLTPTGYKQFLTASGAKVEYLSKGAYSIGSLDVTSADADAP